MWPYVQVVETCLNVVLQTSADIQLVWLKSWELWLNPIKKFQISKKCAKHFFYLYEDYERTSTCIETINFKK